MHAMTPPNSAVAPIARFYRMIEAAQPPRRADRSAAGTLPTRATRYCDAVTTASAFGWYVFPPMDFQLLFDGEDVFWTYDDVDGWMPLTSAQFPDMATHFDEAAPAHLRGFAPPFLTALPEPGVVQIWTGLIARTLPGWNLHVRAPANMWIGGGYTLYEGIIESDRWFGPLFTNLRMTRTDTPLRIRAELPLIQVQPLPRAVFGDDVLDRLGFVAGMDVFCEQDWRDYETTVVRPNKNPDRLPGQYATGARRRRKSECPFSGVAAGPVGMPSLAV
jgi:hypothetical protein